MSAKVTQLYPQASGQESALAREFKTTALDAISGLLDAMFDGADDTLFSMSQKAESNQGQHLYFDAMRAVRLERPNISRVFIDELGRSIINGPGNEAGGRGEYLDLMPPDELEENIAVSNMVTKAGGRCRQGIAELEGRMTTLAEREEAPIATTGLSPTSICRAFKQAMAPVDLHIEVKLLIYKLFDHTVIGRLGEIYDALNQQLERHNIVSRQRSGDASRPTRGARRNHGKRWADRLASLKHEIAPENHYGTGEILQTLTSLQSEAENDSDYNDPNDLLDALLGRLRSNQSDSSPRAIQRDERRLIGLVATMFNDILEDNSVSVAAKPLISQIRMPVIKVALLDPGFFRDADHPARLLVNELATLVVEENSRIYRQARALVEQLIEEFEEDPRVLESVAQALRRLGSEADSKRKADRTPDRAGILERAKRMAILELRQQTLGRFLPDAAKPFLLKAWGPLMAIHYLRHGLDSEQWYDAVCLLGRVLDAVQPPGLDTDRDMLRQEQEAVIKLVRQRLRDLSMGRGRVAELVSSLEKAFLQVYESESRLPSEETEEMVASLSSWDPDETVFDDQGQHDATGSAFDQAIAASFPSAGQQAEAAGPAQERKSPRPKADAPTESTKAAPQQPAQEQASVAQPDPERPITVLDETVERLLTVTCKPGVWFQIYTGTERGTRWLKVKNYDSQRQAVVFVNRDGEAAFERDALTFAQDLQAKRSQPIYDVDLFEQKLASIIGNHADNIDPD